MLQQTQVATVRGYYLRFIERFPDVQALAAAAPDEVFALWSGLGYYRRASLLQRAAQVVAGELGGRFPTSAAGLQALPGVGRSTAAAIAAFCFDERAAILDGNVRRVLARTHGIAEDLGCAAAQARLWTLAESLLPARGIASYTQGLMDLGATVCLPRAPRCDACPLSTQCVARACGDPLAYPARPRRARRSARSSCWLWLQAGASVWLVPRPSAGIWAGLWSLPEFDSPEAVRSALPRLRGEPRHGAAFVHVLTHLDWTLQPLYWTLAGRARHALQDELAALWPGGRWVALKDAPALGLPAPLRRLLAEAGRDAT
jgi:A/G-specific adenine glycosylase